MLGRSEAPVLPWFALALFVFSIAAAIWPRLLAWSLAALAAWFSVALFGRYLRLRRVARETATA